MPALIDPYIITTAMPLRRASEERPQYLALEGDFVTWSPKRKHATEMEYRQAVRIRRRLVGGAVYMLRIARD